jgi:acyl-CoA thioester hydrolase
MYTSETTIRVHYALTDQMGVVYHGHYAQFYEIGRTDAIRALGVTYKDIEAMGIIMPVIDLHLKFLLPAKFDELITVKTYLKEIPQSYKVIFYGEIYNEKNQLLNIGEVTMYFMESQTMKKCLMPEALNLKLQQFF